MDKCNKMYSAIHHMVTYPVDSIKIYPPLDYPAVPCGTDLGIAGLIVLYFAIGVFGIVFCKAQNYFQQWGKPQNIIVSGKIEKHLTWED